MLTKRWIALTLLTFIWAWPAVAQYESSRGDPDERAPVVAAKWPFRFGKNLFGQRDESKDPFLTEGASAQQDLARQLSPPKVAAQAMPATGFEPPADNSANSANDAFYGGRSYPWPAPIVAQVDAAAPNAVQDDPDVLSAPMPPIPISTTTTWGNNSVDLQSPPNDGPTETVALSSAATPVDGMPSQVIQTHVVSADQAMAQEVATRATQWATHDEAVTSAANLANYTAQAPAAASYPRPDSAAVTTASAASVPSQSAQSGIGRLKSLPSDVRSTTKTSSRSKNNRFIRFIDVIRGSRENSIATPLGSPAPRFSPNVSTYENVSATAAPAAPAVTTFQAGGPSTLPSNSVSPKAVSQAVNSASRDTDFVPMAPKNQTVAAVAATAASLPPSAQTQPGVGPIDQNIWGPSFATATSSTAGGQLGEQRTDHAVTSSSTLPAKATNIDATADSAASRNELSGDNASIRRDPRVALLDAPELQSQHLPLNRKTVDTRGTLDEGTDVLAVVGNQTILKGDVLGQVNEQLAPYREQVSPQELAAQRDLVIQNLLPRLIEQKLIFYDFLKVIPLEKLPELEKVVFDNFNKKKLPEILDKTGLKTASELDAKLRELGSSLATQQRLYFEQMLAAEAVNRQVEREPEVSHEEMLEYYAQHAAAYEFPAKVRWEQLSVQVDQFPNWQQAYNSLVQMGNAVKQGVPFEQVAAANSQGPRAASGGQYDWTTQGSLVAKEVDRVLFSIKPNEMSKIISDGGNYYIVRVNERVQAGRKPFTSVQAEIKSKIQDQRFQAGVEEYVKRLRRDTYVWTRGSGDVIPSQFTEPKQP